MRPRVVRPVVAAIAVAAFAMLTAATLGACHGHADAPHAEVNGLADEVAARETHGGSPGEQPASKGVATNAATCCAFAMLILAGTVSRRPRRFGAGDRYTPRVLKYSVPVEPPVPKLLLPA